MLEYKVQDITNEYLAPKFFYYTEQIAQVLTKRGILSFFTVAYRPILTMPKEVLGKDYLTVTGHPEEIRAIKEYPIVHVSDKNDKPDLTLVDPLGKYTVYGIIPINEQQLAFIKLSDDSSDPVYDMGDKFYITNGMIANYTASEKLLTDVGKFLCNYIFLADPFKDVIPYQNKLMKADDLDSLVANAILDKKAGRKEYNRYINNGYWFGQDGTIATQSLSPKSLGTDPAIAKRKRNYWSSIKISLMNQWFLLVSRKNWLIWIALILKATSLKHSGKQLAVRLILNSVRRCTSCSALCLILLRSPTRLILLSLLWPKAISLRIWLRWLMRLGVVLTIVVKELLTVVLSLSLLLVYSRVLR